MFAPNEQYEDENVEYYDDEDYVGEEFEVNSDPGEEDHISDQAWKNIINSIHSSKFEERKDEVEKCSVCQDTLVHGQMVKRMDCKHTFHSKCINHWLKQKLICPLCKSKIT